jgi:Zn-dependent metalloprotease
VSASLASLRAQKSSLGLNDRDDFQLSGMQTDRFGQTHARFQQLHQGVPVWGAMAITHLDSTGLNLPTTVEGVRKGIRVSTRPLVDAGNAIALASLELSSRGALLGGEPTAELIIYPETQRENLAPEKPFAKQNAADFTQEVVDYRLAWHVHTELDNPQDGIVHTDFILDAESGAVLKKWNSLETTAAIGTGLSQHNGNVQLNVWKNASGVYELRDTTRTDGAGLRTYDVNHAKVDLGEPATLTLYTDADNTWGDNKDYVPGANTLSANGQTAAVDAHYGLLATWDYFERIHGRWGIDGEGTPTYNRVHVNNNYQNAFWSDGCFCMSYGDGAFNAKTNPYAMKSMAALDVSAHELGHGITSQTADLIYAGEPGGLNEASSDIFGTMTEFWVRNGRGDTIGGGDKGNWFIGEDLNPYSALRVMFKPSLDGVSADAWFPGIENIDVHHSSGPMNRAFYFLSQGAKPMAPANHYSSKYLPGGMDGIGNDKAAAIWYRAITTYLYSSANYLAARTASLQSAADLFGTQSAEYRAVENAFAAINVGFTAGTYDDREAPKVIASVSGRAPVLELNATATDNVGVARVEFFVDGALQGKDTSQPFMVPLEVSTLDNGKHQLVVVAYDVAGNVAQSDPLDFNVSNSFEQLLMDPGFELGGEGWEANPRGNINFPVSKGARTGQGYVWLNGYGSVSRDNLYQDVTIPASAARTSLSFYLNLTTEETDTVANDILVVQVRSTSGELLETLATWSNLDANLGWVQRSFDLSAYAGQTIRIYLEGSENASRASNFKLDDFSLRFIETADTEAPFVTAQVVDTGTKVGLFANVSDNGFVGGVEFLLDGKSLGTTFTSFATLLNVSSLTNGAHTLVARAVDAAGNAASSAPVSFFVDVKRKQLVVNSSFEDTSAAGRAAWPFTTSLSTSLGFYALTPSNPFAHSGNTFFIIYTNPGPTRSELHQTVTIPADSTSAIYSFWLRLYSGAFADGLPHHTLLAKVRDSNGAELKTLKSFSNLDDTGGKYFEHRFDLSAYKGQTIQLSFEADLLEEPTVDDEVTQLFLDDVTLTSTSTPDTRAPTLTASVDGSHGTIQLNASVSDNIWTKRLEFFVDGAPAGTRTDPSGSYRIPFDASKLSNGPHTLLVKAVDSANNEASQTVDFDIRNSTVNDVTAPSVSATASNLFELFTLKAAASDNTGVTHVEFFVDGAFVGQANRSPYEVTYTSALLTKGEHTVTAVAYDAYGNSGKGETFIEVSLPFLTLSPARVVMARGDTKSFTVSVENAKDTSVSWSAAGSTTCGSVNRDGLYTAGNKAGVCQVIATSNANKSTNIKATVIVYTGDLNGDEVVDGADMGLLAQAYGRKSSEAAPLAADLDADSFVDNNDVTLFVSQFGR